MMLPPFDLILFSDASFDPSSSLGVGAFVALNGTEWRDKTPFTIQTKVIPEKNIARLELVTALWALESAEHCRICLVTDSKTIVDLPNRREKLQSRHFQSLWTLHPLANADLYVKFFEVCDRLKPNLIWVKGHSPRGAQGDLEKTFSQVDKAARRALREYLRNY
jgi:ribonuclease HI